MTRVLRLLFSVGFGWWLVGAPGSVSAQDLFGNPQRGKGIYEQQCQRCHGAGGWGDGPDALGLKIPPANFHRFITQMKSDEQLFTTIEFGLALSPMHGWRGRLTDQQMEDVIAYVRALAQRGR